MSIPSQNTLPSGSTAQQPTATTSTSTTTTPPPTTSRSRPTSLQQRPAGFELTNLTNTPDSRSINLKPLHPINAAVAEILSLDNLPEVPDDLRTHVAAYIQRARELSSKDPVMCYWCTHDNCCSRHCFRPLIAAPIGLYFAAKRGVGARTSRQWLFKLMDTLEMVCDSAEPIMVLNSRQSSLP